MNNIFEQLFFAHFCLFLYYFIEGHKRVQYMLTTPTTTLFDVDSRGIFCKIVILVGKPIVVFAAKKADYSPENSFKPNSLFIDQQQTTLSTAVRSKHPFLMPLIIGRWKCVVSVYDMNNVLFQIYFSLQLMI